MTTKRRLAAAIVLALATGFATDCGRIAVDNSPFIRGTLVSVDGGTIGIRHKTGRTYEVDVPAETRIVNRATPGDRTLCPGQTATVFVSASRRLTASSITLWSGRCR